MAVLAAQVAASNGATPVSAPTTVRTLAVGEGRERWNDFVEHAPGATPFHHFDWCDSVEAAFGHRPRHMLAERGGRVVGVLPLFEMRSALAGRLLISVPYSTYGGALAADGQAVASLGCQAQRLADESGARCLELRCATEGLPGAADYQRYATFIRRLPADERELATFLPRKARAAARQAERRDGLIVEHDQTQLRVVWWLYARSMRRLASINYPYRFFDELVGRFGRRAWVTIVRNAERPLAGLLSIEFGDTIYPYFVGADERVRATGATNLLYFAVMRRAVEQGLAWFDFGRSRRDNAGALAFKAHQGFEPRPLGYLRYGRDGVRTPDLSPNNPRFALARRVWPYLPLSVTQSLGSWLSRSIPG